MIRFKPLVGKLSETIDDNQGYESLKCSLNLVEETDGVIRVYGRIQRANLPDEIRNPVMLDRNHKVAELILWDCHHRGIRAKHWLNFNRNIG